MGQVESSVKNKNIARPPQTIIRRTSTVDPEDLPGPMEAERPRGYTEFISGPESWEVLGIRIKWTKPKVPGKTSMHMLDPLVIKVCVECKKPVPLRYLSAYAWTCLFHKNNIEGIYREIPLPYDPHSRKWDDNGVTTYEFENTVYPTNTDTYRLTYNVKYENYMIWADLNRVDQIITVIQPKAVNEFTRTAQTARVTDNIYIGNYLSILLAEEHLFDAVLALQAGLDNDVSVMGLVKALKTENLPMGGGKEISEEKILNVVQWMQKASAKYYKVLVGDREGQGRAGSAMTAYLFANNPNLTFQEAYDLVQSRKMIYCHKGLHDLLYKLYPRD